MTVEIMFAVTTGAILAAVLFLVIASPVFFADLPGTTEKPLLMAAAAAAALGFVVRVVRGLWRQPSQPGRTSPDS
ncbi:DUF6332 family protein [Streptomyces sp. H27-D2]|uniref:DUF6332 family protein n=1 Tax=Streptomyces sp. H27-D2 TaxID=3046304 RepID=UPI002DBE90D4|nr:DUF6332 family protein [Streptomyces sp. H27-D2]MEC4019061.1 DUF6332 family protein [Streptomyces sp. H27-D2]